MKWIVGLDMRTLSHGAASFAAWMRRQQQENPDELSGIHVLEEEIIDGLRGFTTTDEVTRQVDVRIHESLKELGLAEDLASVAVVPGRAADVTLAAAVGLQGADGIIVGRWAYREGVSLLHLGRTARRLLRRLPCPVVVVPPDLGIEAVGDGPVLLLTDLHESSSGAARFADQFAKRTGRELMTLTTRPFPEGYGTQYLAPGVLAEARDAVLQHGKLAIENWLVEHDLQPRKYILRLGRMLAWAHAEIEDQSPSLVVIGSRRLDAFERFFVSSIGSALAGTAPCAVAVVSATWGVAG